MLPARAAYEIGLITQVFADDSFDADVEAYAAKLAEKSASAVTLGKRLLYQIDSVSFEAALEAGVEMNAIARMTDDCRAGIVRF